MSSSANIACRLRLTRMHRTGPYEVLARSRNTAVHLVAQGLYPVKTT